jgi:uncharacterized protein YeeX (DUF496 family)
MYIPFVVEDTQDITKFGFDFLVLLVTIGIGVTLWMAIKGKLKANKVGLILGWIAVAIAILVMGTPIYLLRKGVRKDIIGINKKLGITEKIPFLVRGNLYYREYFRHRLKVGMKKEEINEIIKEPSETNSYKDRNDTVIIYHYKIGKHGFSAGYDLFIRVMFDDNGIAKSIGYDNS